MSFQVEDVQYDFLVWQVRLHKSNVKWVISNKKIRLLIPTEALLEKQVFKCSAT